MGTVEDRDFTLHGLSQLDAPETVVRLPDRRRRFEGRLLHAVGRQAGEHRGDRSVLSGRVHRLEPYDQGLLLFRVKPALQLQYFAKLSSIRFSARLRSCSMGISSVEIF